MKTKEELEIIVKGCVKGKRRYQHELFKLYYGKMIGVCMRYAKDRDEAEDMVQNGFIKVFKNLEVYNFTGSLEGWIRRIMVNTAIDQIRKNKRSPFNIDDDSNIKDTGVEFDPIESNELKEEQVLLAERALEAINQLSVAYKTVFNLYVIEGYTHKEIAEHLGISEGTSKSNLAKARQKLKKILS